MSARASESIQPVRFQDGETTSVPNGVSDDTVSALKEHIGADFKFFAMQSAVISHLLHATRVQRPGDVVLRSPTGSGKTLAYVIPIVERLRMRTIPRLRAIVIVPTHDLAVQVQSVFQLLTRETSISCVVATGAVPIAVESRLAAKAEVLIATPGRLLDHVENTRGVTLSFVEFLVLDESDRILQDSFYGWADVVMPRCGMRDVDNDKEKNHSEFVGPCAGILSLAAPATLLPHHARTSLTRKILVSATATRDPQRIAKLHLHRVTYFEPHLSDTGVGIAEVDGNYSVPKGLTECAFVIDSPERKPMGLVSVLGWNPVGSPLASKAKRAWKPPVSQDGSKLIFTKSVVSAHRLARLLELFSWKIEPRPIILEITRDVSPERRENVLTCLRNSENSNEPKRPVIVVCSDVFARGMDMLSVGTIINYDVPPRLWTYLHRVGRTARAGRSGVAVTLLLSKQVRHFRAMVKGIDRGDKKCNILDIRFDALRRAQQSALLSTRLNSMHKVLRRELLGLLVVGVSLPGHVLAEMSVDDESLMFQIAEKRKLESSNGKTPKRQRTNSTSEEGLQNEIEVKGSQDIDGVCTEGGDEDDENILDDDGSVAKDLFRDIVAAHISCNWLRNHSNGG